ncbi:MAG: hypothetical protein H0W02_13265 [Ktedonobacteraceae bacterium]|nr:hypothetical protein [Ktedonobacteraceae bacterium]
MQGSEQTETAVPTEQAVPGTISETGTPVSGKSAHIDGGRGFDWLAVGIVAVVATILALATRINAQPSSTLTPIAVLSAIGCGLLVTAIRKLRTTRRPGLPEAAVSGFFLAFIPFLAALTYPEVISVLSTDADQRQGFFSTWALVVGCSILFSIIGAVLGHLAFAPLRQAPVKQADEAESEISPLDEEENTTLQDDEVEPATTDSLDGPETATEASLDTDRADDSLDEAETTAEASLDTDGAVPAAHTPQPARSLVSYLVTIVLFALAPTVVAYIFAAAFDFMLSVYQYTPGPYPTLRLFSGMLPWQVPIPLHLSGPNVRAIILLLWRIPLFLGNPAAFDVLSLEPFIISGAALGLLLLTMHSHGSATSEPAPSLSWPKYLLLEAVLGLLLVLAPDLWVLRGLEGLLQIPALNFVLPIRTLHILDPLNFTLNLVSGPLVCMLIGLLLRRMYQGSRPA